MEQLNRSVKGIVGELVVCANLLRNGFSVFQNICDIDGIDFIIKKGDKIKTIQIKNAETYDSKEKRYSFRFGNNGNVADFTICICNKSFYIIPKCEARSSSIFIRPEGNISRYNKYKGRWDFPEPSENKIFPR